MELVPFLGVECIKQGNDGWIIETMVTQPLSDLGPVFLFDMRIVVFMVGSASGKLNRMRSLAKMTQQMIVKEFRAIIAVEAA